MRICLLATHYPPESTEGIARQRQALAAALARRSHEVHVVTSGPYAGTRDEQGVHVHRVAVRATNHYGAATPALDSALSYSQALHEALLRLLANGPFDIVDVPFWAAPGIVTLRSYAGATVLWMQTTSTQLLRLSGQPPSPADRQRVALEQACIPYATGVLYDSVAAQHATAVDYDVPADALLGVAHLGLPLLEASLPAERRPDGLVEALVVGRLEQRKGTPLLFELLPALLERHPQLRVRFVGRDNSANDGWRARHQTDYAGYFRRRHPGLMERVRFDGGVSEGELLASYGRADMVLAPSLYESFGLVYLEAMRASRPVVAFASGGASEIFPAGEQHGALLARPGDGAALAQGIARLVEQPSLRHEIGAHGHARFLDAFTAAHMADATLAFYERVVERQLAREVPNRPVFQVMEALDVGDSVSSITRRNAALLGDLGATTTILARFTHPDVQHETRPAEYALATPGAGLIFHFWGYNGLLWLLDAMRGPKAMHYHNITPPHFFPTDTALYHNTARGYDQLREIAGRFDLLIGDSRYNIAELAPFLDAPRPALAIYPALDARELQAQPYDAAFVEALRQSGEVQVVFVGRIARNKRQDLVMQLFDYYCRQINRYCRLWLVGSDQGDAAYRSELERLRQTLPSGERIAFTGKVPDATVDAYLRAAHIYVSASEHEGFGMPLIQAMAFDVPVLAYAATAVPETMGGSGLLVHRWDVPRVAELMHLAISDARLRERLVSGQRANLDRFTLDATRTRLAAVMAFLRDGTLSPLFEQPNVIAHDLAGPQALANEVLHA
jgi:glycosyltransferase involved in cell wall biosynthesis